MTKRATTARLPVTVDQASTVPLGRQVYDWIRGAILTGQLVAGSRMPSTRALASQLGVSRNTVFLAYEQLLAEGYLVARVGEGTHVAPTLPAWLSPMVHERQQVIMADTTHPGDQHRYLSARGRLMVYTPFMTPFMPGAPGTSRASGSSDARSESFAPSVSAVPRFPSGLPDLSAFPYDLWARLLARRARDSLPHVSGYQDPAGYRPLREAIAAHVGVARGIRCTADQIIMVAGSQGGIDLAARLLLDPRDAAWVEDPGFPGAQGALLAAGARLVLVPVDAGGLLVDEGRARAPEARLAVVTPSHQFPTGATMSLPRRLALLAWAREASAWILEDDYDSEYRFGGRPIEALAGLDSAGRVIYAGTFSKVLFPALRLGYLIVPPALAVQFAAARRFIDAHMPILEQMALDDFMRAGHFSRHIRRMRTIYAARRAALSSAIREEFSGLLELAPQEAGMHVVGWLPPDIDDQLAAHMAAEGGVDVLPISTFVLDPPSLRRGGLLLGYGGLSEREIRANVRRLAAALRPLLA
jgi:GntR family transcriptional regulator/MocR family aminotransferase